MSYQQQIFARLRSLVWSEELTNDKLLSEALPLSKVVFFWRVIISSATRNYFVRSVHRRVELFCRKESKKQVAKLKNRGAAFFCHLEGHRNWNTE